MPPTRQLPFQPTNRRGTSTGDSMREATLLTHEPLWKRSRVISAGEPDMSAVDNTTKEDQGASLSIATAETYGRAEDMPDGNLPRVRDGEGTRVPGAQGPRDTASRPKPIHTNQGSLGMVSTASQTSNHSPEQKGGTLIPPTKALVQNFDTTSQLLVAMSSLWEQKLSECDMAADLDDEAALLVRLDKGLEWAFDLGDAVELAGQKMLTAWAAHSSGETG